METLLVRFTNLRHLILDGCSLRRFDAPDGEWSAMGKICSLAGVKRAKEREKRLKGWLEGNAIRSAPITHKQPIADETGLIGRGTRRLRRGRRGLATATISLREPPGKDGDISTPNSSLPINIPVSKIRILPPSPSLASLAIMASSQISSDRHANIRADFEKGWVEGLAQLAAIRSRLRHSWQNGTRVVRFSEESSISEEGLNGLVEVEGDEAGFDSMSGEDVRTPVLCLAGPGRNDGHLEGCGHEVGWDLWKDDL